MQSKSSVFQVNEFKISYQLTRNSITNLGEYRVLKISNLKLKKKGYDPEVLERRIKESIRMQGSKINESFSKDSSGDSFMKQRQLVFQNI
jgi:hypothetical protein